MSLICCVMTIHLTDQDDGATASVDIIADGSLHSMIYCGHARSNKAYTIGAVMSRILQVHAYALFMSFGRRFGAQTFD